MIVSREDLENPEAAPVGEILRPLPGASFATDSEGVATNYNQPPFALPNGALRCTQNGLAKAMNGFADSTLLWSDIRRADARNPAGVDFYSQPGRSVAARIEYAF